MPQSLKRTQEAEETAATGVDPSSAEVLLDAMHLGQRIRRLRLKRSMGLVELGKLTGLSASFLSQLETGRVVPTLRNLARLSLVFEKDLSYFFQTPDHGVFRIQRSKDRVRLKMGAPDVDYVYESFGILIPDSGIRPCLAEFFPGDEHIFHPEIFPGVEFVYVTEGTLELRRNGETHLIESQDVVYIGGETTRTYRCIGDKPARAILVGFDGQPGSSRLARRAASGS